MNKNELSVAEQQKRNELLNARPAKIIFKTALPLLVFSCTTMIFQFFDVLTVSKIDQSMVSTVLFAGDIQNLIDCLFYSMSVGLGIRISQYFGAGDADAIKRDISTVFFTVLFLSLIIVGPCMLFSGTILSFFGIPREMQGIGSTYFSISIISTIFSSINIIYFASEKARGRTRTVSVCNLVLLFTKLFFNFLIMYLIRNGALSKDSAVILLPLSVCISQFLILTIALRDLFSKKSPFRISRRYIAFRKVFFIPFFKLIIPIMLIRLLNDFSKVICNSYYAVYGSIGLAAYACCNKITAFVSTPLTAFQDASTTIIGANLGNHRYDRVKQTMSDSLWLTFAIAIALFTAVAISSESLIRYFASGNIELMGSIRTLYRIQRLDFLFLALDNVCSSYLFATKKTKVKTVSSFLQKIVIRIPLLNLLIHHYHLGIEAIAITILISNITTSLFTAVSYLFIKRDYESSLEADTKAETRLMDAVRSLGRLDAFDSDNSKDDRIIVPTDILQIMKEAYEADIDLEKLSEEYKFALIEARIDELEKQEYLYGN